MNETLLESTLFYVISHDCLHAAQGLTIICLLNIVMLTGMLLSGSCTIVGWTLWGWGWGEFTYQTPMPGQGDQSSLPGLSFQYDLGNQDTSQLMTSSVERDTSQLRTSSVHRMFMLSRVVPLYFCFSHYCDLSLEWNTPGIVQHGLHFLQHLCCCSVTLYYCVTFLLWTTMLSTVERSPDYRGWR
jgi:hypothetical protein